MSLDASIIRGDQCMLFFRNIPVQTNFEHFLGADSENHSGFAQKLVLRSLLGGSQGGVYGVNPTKSHYFAFFCKSLSKLEIDPRN